MNEDQPLVSVVMSVYNEEKYIEQAIESILGQTLQSFEVLIVDDCSTDRTGEILGGYQDSRIRVFRNQKNKGLTHNLNEGLQHARGKYIARMDGDDICLPERFEKQIRYLEAHPDYMLISCQTLTFGEQDLRGRLTDQPEALRVRMLIRPVLAHPGFMMRRELVFDYGYRYNEAFRSAQDYDFAVRVSEKFPIGIAPEILLKYRAHPGQVSAKGAGSQFENADKIRAYQWEKLGAVFSEEQKKYYRAWVLEERGGSFELFAGAWKLIGIMLSANEVTGVYDAAIMEDTLKRVFFTWVVRNKALPIYLRVPKICGHHLKDCLLFIKEACSIIKGKAQR